MVPRDILQLLEDGNRCGVYTAAQAAWGWLDSDGELPTGEENLGSGWVGTIRERSGVAISGKTRFDIASLTKIFTASAVLRMADRGELDLRSPLEEVIPEPICPSQGRSTIAQLLAHEAGFQAWLPLFEQIPLEQRGTAAARNEIIDLCLCAPPAAAPGKTVIYSDIGFIVLTHLVETVARSPIDVVIQREVVDPLGLSSVHFRPLEKEGRSPGFRRTKDGSSSGALVIAATELCPWRAVELRGEVHDDNAWSMGGISGHAGLFATAADVARLGLAWLWSVREGGWISRARARQAIARRPLGRGLGWDLKTVRGASAGEKFSPDAFGHLGYTGCSLWVDPERSLCGALCTNRVHFGRNNLSIRQFRPKFHDLLVDAFETDRGIVHSPIEQ